MKCQVITKTKRIYFNCILSYNEKQILFLRVSNYSLMITFQLLIRDLSTQTWLGLPSKQHQYIHVMNTSDIYNIHIYVHIHVWYYVWKIKKWTSQRNIQPNDHCKLHNLAWWVYQQNLFVCFEEEKIYIKSWDDCHHDYERRDVNI